jgi:threonine dehydrogenase-like Zn-dependent dehydrogenase
MQAVVMSGYGTPDVLNVSEVDLPEPGPGQIRLAGVGPTDLAIRAGHLRNVFPMGDPAILGFEAAGVVDAVGAGVDDVAPGDEVAASLPGLGGYAGYVVADYWVRKPETVSWADAAAVPASGEAAVRVLRLLGVAAGETLLILGGAGAVGTIAAQLAVSAGVTVISAVRERDFAATGHLGATPIDYARPLGDSVTAVDAVLDAAGRSDLETRGPPGGWPGTRDHPVRSTRPADRRRPLQFRPGRNPIGVERGDGPARRAAPDASAAYDPAAGRGRRRACRTGIRWPAHKGSPRHERDGPYAVGGFALDRALTRYRGSHRICRNKR